MTNPQRTVISLQQGLDDQMFVQLRRTPNEPPNARVLLPFECQPDEMPPWNDPSAVQEYGKQILRALRKHNAIDQALTNVLMTPNNQVHALLFDVDAGGPEKFFWEALCNEENRFLSLDQRWPIARVADSVAERNIAPYREFVPPLKLMACLSAIDLPAAPEWERLKGSIADAQKQGLDVELTILVGERDLLVEIKDEITAKSLPDKTTVEIIASGSELLTAIQQAEPHILHFFCHGVIGGGLSWLELGNQNDWLTEEKRGSVRLRIDELANLRAIQKLWMVTLNCCNGANVAEQPQSMARHLVDSGVPAAVGMLEPIDATDAHEFCDGFYSELFDLIRNAVGHAENEGEPSELEWAQALHSARRKMVERLRRQNSDANSSRQWALPALYVRPERFRLIMLGVVGGGISDEVSEVDMMRMRIQAEEVAGFLRALPPHPNTPDSVRTSVLEILEEANIPKAMWPNRDGQFVEDEAITGADESVPAPTE